MKAKDTYTDRLRMADMHNDVLQRLEKAISEKRSIEACWLCYSCFESRITRTMEKLSEDCLCRRCYQNYKVGIKTKIDCLKHLRKLNYSGAERFDSQLLGDIIAWCKERNTLVHALVSLNNYYGIDDKFLKLAVKGKPLVEKLYSQATQFRNQYYGLEEMPTFPCEVEKKCRLLKTDKSKE